MKTTKIDFRTKIAFTFFPLLVLITFFISCDVLEPDADVLEPEINVTGEPVYVLSSGSAFIDLNLKVRASKPVRLSITSLPKHGELSDLGEGLLQYDPSVDNKKVRDEFEFTVYSQRDEIIMVDTVIIRIENDSTNLPCSIFPINDHVYGVRKGIELDIDVLANDYICGSDSADLVLGVYRAPRFGAAFIKDQTVIYTPGNTFEGLDQLVYMVYPAGAPERAVYGMVYLTGEQACDFILEDDVFMFEADSLSHVVSLPVLQNDTLCQSASNLQINISQAPKFGIVQVNGQHIDYQVGDTVTASPSFHDTFVYEVCVAATCKTARVDVGIKASDVCTLMAVADSMDLSGNSIPLMYLGVLGNDIVCEGYTSFLITQPPLYGTAFISLEHAAIGYERNLEINKNDSLEYQICNTEGCSRAKVFIRRE